MARHIFRLLIFVAVLLGEACYGHTAAEVGFKCPIDGHKWKQTMDMSGTTFGMRLDFKALGPVASPWAIPQCPKCHCVFEGRKDEPVPSPSIKAYVQSAEYQTAAAEEPSYGCLALLMEKQGAEPLKVAQAWLRASWQSEDRPALLLKHHKRALHAFNLALAGKLEPEDLVNASLLVCELERRLGRYQAAEQHCRAMLRQKEFESEDTLAILRRQLHLIAAENNAPHGLTAKDEELLKN